MINSLHIAGKRWYRRGFGGTYNTAEIFVNGKPVAKLIMQYGSGDCFLQRSLAWLYENEYFTPEQKSQYSTTTVFLRDVLGGTYSVADVKRERDL